MKVIIEPSREVPVIDEADVIVVGGGTSGFIAATAAARTGAKTILVEQFGYLGGCTTTSYNTQIARFRDSDNNEIIKGIPWEFVERMEKEGEALTKGYEGAPQLWPPTTKKVALDMIEEEGVELYFHTMLIDVIRDESTIKGIIVHNKGGRGAILGKTFIDATGDADLTAFAGAPFEMTETENLQQVSMDLIACGVDSAKVIQWARDNKDKLGGVKEDLCQPKLGEVQSNFTFYIPNAETVVKAGGESHVGVMPTVKLCVHRDAVRLQGSSDINPLDPKALTYAEVNGLRGALKHLKYLKESVPGFENAYVVAQTHLGVRETRRIVGDYMLKLEDLLNNSRFEDVIALNCRALDYHLRGTVFKVTHLKGNHDIPLRSLLPKGIDNLIVAGRSISSDHLSQASTRGAATCMATGHAAGTAAALAAKGNGRFRELDIKKLQSALVKQGVILGTGERAKLFG